MTYCNITHPDREERYDRAALDLAIARTERDHFRCLYDKAVRDLTSIAERAANGEDVYIVMPDGELLYLIKKPDQEAKRDD